MFSWQQGPHKDDFSHPPTSELLEGQDSAMSLVCLLNFKHILLHIVDAPPKKSGDASIQEIMLPFSFPLNFRRTYYKF